jgi:hypothetical protein
MRRRDQSLSLSLPDVKIPSTMSNNPRIIQIPHADSLRYSGTVVIFMSAIAPITINPVPIIAHAPATTPVNNTTTDAKSNNDVGLEKIATPATSQEMIVDSVELIVMISFLSLISKL